LKTKNNLLPANNTFISVRTAHLQRSLSWILRLDPQATSENNGLAPVTFIHHLSILVRWCKLAYLVQPVSSESDLLSTNSYSWRRVTMTSPAPAPAEQAHSRPSFAKVRAPNRGH
jgi:hypothetical protein